MSFVLPSNPFVSISLLYSVDITLYWQIQTTHVTTLMTIHRTVYSSTRGRSTLKQRSMSLWILRWREVAPTLSFDRLMKQATYVTSFIEISDSYYETWQDCEFDGRWPRMQVARVESSNFSSVWNPPTNVCQFCFWNIFTCLWCRSL